MQYKAGHHRNTKVNLLELCTVQLWHTIAWEMKYTACTCREYVLKWARTSLLRYQFHNRIQHVSPYTITCTTTAKNNSRDKVLLTFKHFRPRFYHMSNNISCYKVLFSGRTIRLFIFTQFKPKLHKHHQLPLRLSWSRHFVGELLLTDNADELARYGTKLCQSNTRALLCSSCESVNVKNWLSHSFITSKKRLKYIVKLDHQLLYKFLLFRSYFMSNSEILL